jgi:GMP synthase (glutamine-hydrolysing)
MPLTQKREKLSILLMQIRDDQETREEELAEFVRYSQIPERQFTVLNVFETPYFEASCVKGYDALFVGGSSDASVIQPEIYPFVEDAKKLLLHCVDQDIPVFASCFGFQLVVEALGGKVILDKESMEMGTYPLQRTEAAQSDVLFCDVPNEFWAVSGHKERAAFLPEDAILLASSALCPHHALKIRDKPFYGFQFHPELDKQDLSTRITRYRDRYLDSHDMLQDILDNLQETPESNNLIQKFVDRVILG